MNRELFVNIKIDKRGKKVPYFGKVWGQLPKKEANTRAIKTGNGLMVVDVDSKKLSKIDKKLVQLLPGTPTVETANGYHWYFEGADEIPQTQALVHLVDTRNEGGLVFDKYWGDDKRISYKKTGKVYKCSKKLLAYLVKLSDARVSRASETVKLAYVEGEPWAQFADGEQHIMLMATMVKMFNDRATEDMVWSRAKEYQANYLSGKGYTDKHESFLMKGRFDWAVKTVKKELTGTKLATAERSPKEIKKAKKKKAKKIKIKANMKDEDIVALLADAKTEGPRAYHDMKAKLKTATKLPMQTLEDMLTSGVASSLDDYFTGHVCWEGDRGVFMVVNEKGIKAIKKQNFTQTTMSRTGFMKQSDVGEILCGAEDVCSTYRPDMKGVRYFEHAECGSKMLNTYYGKEYKPSKKGEPKMIGKVLDNLFQNDMKARAEFVDWMAWILQTGKQSGVAWAFQGAQGTGKGVMVEVFSRILGVRNCALNVGNSALAEKFTGYADNKQLIHFNEIAIDAKSRHEIAGKLKALVTDSQIQLRLMGTDTFTVDNYCNIILHSNKHNPLELEDGDRRWNVVACSTPLVECGWWKETTSYESVMDEVKAFARHLMSLSVRAPRVMAKSVAKANIIEATSTRTEQLGVCINKGESLREFFIDDKLGADVLDGIKWADKNMKYTNKLLGQLLAVTMHRDEPVDSYMVKRMLGHLLTKKRVGKFYDQSKRQVRGWF